MIGKEVSFTIDRVSHKGVNGSARVVLIPKETCPRGAEFHLRDLPEEFRNGSLESLVGRTIRYTRSIIGDLNPVILKPED